MIIAMVKTMMHRPGAERSRSAGAPAGDHEQRAPTTKGDPAGGGRAASRRQRCTSAARGPPHPGGSGGKALQPGRDDNRRPVSDGLGEPSGGSRRRVACPPRARNNRLPVPVAWGRWAWWGSGRRTAAAGALVRRVLGRCPHLLRVPGCPTLAGNLHAPVRRPAATNPGDHALRAVGPGKGPEIAASRRIGTRPRRRPTGALWVGSTLGGQRRAHYRPLACILCVDKLYLADCRGGCPGGLSPAVLKLY